VKVDGKFFSPLDPLKFGPRHCIQSSATEWRLRQSVARAPIARGEVFMGYVRTWYKVKFR
jgi:hypothetical protein